MLGTDGRSYDVVALVVVADLLSHLSVADAIESIIVFRSDRGTACPVDLFILSSLVFDNSSLSVFSKIVSSSLFLASSTVSGALSCFPYVSVG